LTFVYGIGNRSDLKVHVSSEQKLPNSTQNDQSLKKPKTISIEVDQSNPHIYLALESESGISLTLNLTYVIPRKQQSNQQLITSLPNAVDLAPSSTEIVRKNASLSQVWSHIRLQKYMENVVMN
jgi:hypothetical protein